MPTLAMHYVLTGDETSLEKAIGFMEKLLVLEHWETGKELDAGMSSANILIGAAICYDFLYQQLDPAFREQFRRKLLLMARAQYYGGHLNKNKSMGYWQCDPANNHHWHRNAGLAPATFAACEGNADEQWILNKTAEELAYVAKWLPQDGTSHESPTYLTFGLPHLTLALQAADHCLGTDYFQLPFAQNVARYKLQTICPDFTTGFQFGDSNGIGGYNNALWAYTAAHGPAEVQAGLKRVNDLNPKAFQFGWMALLWQDPALNNGDITKLETTSFFPDLGLAFIRDSWQDNGVAMMIKCCGFGGRTLNAYRNENNYAYINVAHDDPDANSFQIFAQGAMLAEGDRYSTRKTSANYNTILVNGKGQRATGRKPGGWTQPAVGKNDMNDMGFVSGWKDDGNVVIYDGEAGGSYAELNRFRRTVVWVKGEYILLLDDIQAKQPADITWLLQGPDVELKDSSAGNSYELKKSNASMPVSITADRPFTSSITESEADNRGDSLGWKQIQLQLDPTEEKWRVVSLYDPWRRDVKVSMQNTTQDGVNVFVSGNGINDTWKWTRANERSKATSLKGRSILDESCLPPFIFQ
ncbi:MAG: DUF4962 domain-containing protein [Pontiellaceae bacterium]|nr:DUF4962 domain-containing protein [Pontiellaceae bacterium]MBN2786298.1 DUF4962 domain-containing protein [Pontiellaceae bacterium]